MNTRYTTVNLDVSQQGSIPSITLSQYDLGVGLGFYIMDGGLPYSEFAETDTVVLSGTKPSGVGFTVPAYYKSGNLCSFRTPQAMTTEAGTVTCEITITKVNNISVSTANFFVEVEASAHAHETVDEDIEDFSLIANQVGEYKAVAVRAAQQAAQSATDAAASASSAEESMEAAQSAASSAIAAKDDIQEYIDDSEAWARGTRGGTAVPSTDETYENNAKYYAEQSSQASMDAGVSAAEAAASAQEAAASVVGAVKYTAQSLTTEQKAQARTNIGAASPSDIPSGTVRYDTAQSLTDTQKTQALANIGGTFAGSVAGEFSTSVAYAVGDTVVYQGRLYEFTSAHAAGAWNASHVQAISVMDEVSDLKGDLNKLSIAPRLPSVDLNTLQDTAIYGLHTSSTYQHAPLESGNLGYLEVTIETANGINSSIFQRATLYNADDGHIEIWGRRYSVWSETWSEWVVTVDNAVRYDIAQNKTEEEKAQARANIGVDSGLNEQLKNAIFNCFSNVAWSENQGLNLYDNLFNALYEIGEYDMAERYDYEENHPIAIPGTVNTASGSSDATLIRVNTSQTNRRVFGMNNGTHKMKSTSAQELDIYPIPIPKGTTSIVVALDGGYEGNALQFDSYLLLYDDTNSDYKKTKWYGGRTGEKLNLNGQDGDYIILHARLIEETYPNPLQPNINSIKIYFLTE